MKDEFEHREIIMKDRVRYEIQETMSQERSKLSFQLKELEREKERYKQSLMHSK